MLGLSSLSVVDILCSIIIIVYCACPAKPHMDRGRAQRVVCQQLSGCFEVLHISGGLVWCGTRKYNAYFTECDGCLEICGDLKVAYYAITVQPKHMQLANGAVYMYHSYVAREILQLIIMVLHSGVACDVWLYYGA